MNNNPPKTRVRKRNRQVQFDLNRSSPHVLPKIQKPNTPKANSAPSYDEKMTEGEKDLDQIRDLSQTIMTGSSQAPQNRGTKAADRLHQDTSKQLIRELIDPDVSSQIADMKRTMADLAATVGKLSLVVQQTQQENRRLVEANLKNGASATKETPEPMNISGVQTNSAQSSRASPICSEDVSVYHRPRIDKWGLDFDGNASKLAVEDFVFRLERLQAQYRVPWREVLDNFHLLVKGAAEKWYWLYIQTNYVTEWSTLKSALLKQYQTTRSSFELMRDMVERKQMPGESIDDFFFAMVQFRSRLNISMPEEEMIKMIKRNLRESIGRIVYPMTVSSVEELRTTCLDAEKTFLKKDARQQPTLSNRYSRQINELHEEPMNFQPIVDTECEEVAAARVSSTKSSITKTQLICWNCRQNGHAFMDCPSEQRTIFCFRCGKPDVIAPNCESCRKRNFSRSEVRAGELRSTTNPQSRPE